jgi:hypothetical protein
MKTLLSELCRLFLCLKASNLHRKPIPRCREALIKDCDNIDSGENIDSEDNIDTMDQQPQNKKIRSRNDSLLTKQN